MSQELDREMEEMQEENAGSEENPGTGEPVNDGSEGGEPEAAQEKAGETAQDAGGSEEETGGAEASRDSREAESSQAASEEEKEKTGIFGKKKKKDKRDAQIEELTDRVKRTMAEFENFRRRNEREKTHMYEVGARDIIEKMLPVLDNFERGLAAIPAEEKEGAVAQGMEMIYKQMLGVFEQIGVTEIEAEGKEFDPNFHNAVMHEDNEEVGENMITEVFQKGYSYKDSVIRHSMVKVAN